MEENTKRTWAEILLSNLAHNYHTLRALLPADCRFLGVVKANAYGHGAVPVARKLEELGADYLAVACLDEAEELRQAGVTLPILILGVTPAQYAPRMAQERLTQSVGSLAYGKALSDALCGAARLKIHIKTDTGMSRLGFLCGGERREETAAEIAETVALPGLETEGIFTHFADADGESEAYTMLQFTRFLDMIAALECQGVHFAIRHCANSPATLRFPCTHLDMVRPGISLYGHYPAPICEGLDGPGLLPVMRLNTRVADVRTLPGGVSVSYGCSAVLEGERTLAVLPVGYADGLSRALSNCGSVLLGGKRCPIVGRVCMDMCMADVTGLDVKPGDVAEVFGPEHPVEEQAAMVGTIQYELLCAVAPRVPRIYPE